MLDILVVLIIALLLGLSIRYIWKTKRSGTKCIGCPHGKDCSKCGLDFNKD